MLHGAKARAAFRLGEGIIGKGRRVIHIAVRWNHVVVAAPQAHLIVGQAALHVHFQAVHPSQLVIEFIGGDGIAVGQIQGRHAQLAEYRAFHVTRLFVGLAAGQAAFDILNG